MSKSSQSPDSQEGQATQPLDSTAKPLPFEPASSKSKVPKVAPSKVSAKKPSASSRSSATASSEIPEVVSRRMVRRMTFFSGMPTLLGMLTFVVSYFLVKQGGVQLPTSAVLLVSLGFFGLGVVGLSYGILSTSWEEDQVGSLLGIEQFGVNFDRMRSSWREARQKPDA